MKKPRRKRSPPQTIEVAEPDSPIRNEYLNIKDDYDIEANYALPPKVRHERPKELVEEARSERSRRHKYKALKS